MSKTTFPVPTRRLIPETRKAINHQFEVGGYKGYITVGFFEDDTPCEMFISMQGAGATIEGLINTIASMTSLLLQYGVPVEVLVKKFSRGEHFSLFGRTTYPFIREANSIVDYVFRWLQHQENLGYPGDNLSATQ